MTTPELTALRELSRYAQHLNDCAGPDDEGCECGLVDAQAAVEKATDGDDSTLFRVTLSRNAGELA